MVIKNLEDLKININKNTLLIFFIIFFISNICFYFAHRSVVNKRWLLDQQEISFTQSLYKSNLSEKLSIIASATVFLDYLRSGNETRKNTYPKFLTHVLSMSQKSIQGMKIIDSKQRLIFSYGRITPYYIALDLCYLNQKLDSIMGDCEYSWHLFFDRRSLINELVSINHKIKNCTNCFSYDLFSGNKFGSFSIKSSSGLKLNLAVDSSPDYFFYVYLFLMSSALIVFGIWSWLRLGKVVNKYLTNPLKALAEDLKFNKEVVSENQLELEEINFLIGEINSWKSQLKAQADCHVEKISKVAAQLAHDVRSPLSTIDMITKALKNVPENQIIILRKSMQRISTIANSFLTQYKNPSIFDGGEIARQNISLILGEIFLEKKYEYISSDIDFKLFVNNNVKNYLASINADDFKRMISNLINNAFESIREKGTVIVKLDQNEKFLQIEIIDDGNGIKPELLPIISQGGFSVGKKEGTGLGLSHAIKNINQWNGTFNIESRLDFGTTVTIKLPVYI